MKSLELPHLYASTKSKTEFNRLYIASCKVLHLEKTYSDDIEYLHETIGNGPVKRKANYEMLHTLARATMLGYTNRIEKNRVSISAIANMIGIGYRMLHQYATTGFFLTLTISHRLKAPYKNIIDLKLYDDWVHNDQNKLFTIHNNVPPVQSFWPKKDPTTGLRVQTHRKCAQRDRASSITNVFSVFRSTFGFPDDYPSYGILHTFMCNCVRKSKDKECVCAICMQEKFLVISWHIYMIVARDKRGRCCALCDDKENIFWTCSSNTSDLVAATTCKHMKITMFNTGEEKNHLIPRRECCGLGKPNSKYRNPRLYLIDPSGREMFTSRTRGVRCNKCGCDKMFAGVDKIGCAFIYSSD